MNRNRWLVIVIVALVLSMALTFLILRIVNRRAQPEDTKTQIVVAAKKLSLGMRINKDDIQLIDWPKSAPLDGSFSDPDLIIDRGVVATIYPNEPILDAKLAPREGGVGLPSVIPDGMRAVSVKVDNVIGVAGFVLPGTRVDIIVTGEPPNGKEEVSRTVLENIQVLAAGENVEQDANGKPQNVSVVTVLVTPEQAQELVLAGEDHIQLALRNPLDVEEKDPSATERLALFMSDKKAKSETKTVKKSVRPKPAAPAITTAPAPPKPEPRVLTVELINGSSKETLTFTEKIQ